MTGWKKKTGKKGKAPRRHRDRDALGRVVEDDLHGLELDLMARAARRQDDAVALVEGAVPGQHAVDVDEAVLAVQGVDREKEQGDPQLCARPPPQPQGTQHRTASARKERWDMGWINAQVGRGPAEEEGAPSCGNAARS